VRNTAQSLNLATYASDIYAGIRSHLDADPKKEHSIEDADWHASSTQSVISNQIDRVNRWLAVESAAPLLLGLTENSESIQVTWRPSQLTSTEFAVAPYPVTAHRVFYRRAGAPTWKSIDAPGAGSESAQITDLSSGVEYEVRVAAVSTRRVWPSSNTESITLGLPTRVLFAETSAMGKRVRLRWRPPVSFGASTSEDAVYRIEMRPLVGRRWQPGALGKMIPNSAGWYVRWVELTNPERVHEFRIRVETDYGESEWVTLRQAYG
jgi:Fibronectin type III domain